MILNSPYISGSLTVTGNATIQGQLTVTGSLSGTASLASNSLLLEGTGSTGFATTASLLAVSSSQQQISASLLSLTASYNALSSSYTALSASYNVASSSFSTRITSDSSSLSSRTTQIENVYATTGSNSFTGVQNFSNTCTPNSFTAGASLYTAGGLRVTQDAYFSSSVYIKGNVTVYGTQSVAYISSSQLDIGTNIITVNTATPSIRYGGLSVFDSGSTGLTGSIFWDSELNRWIYSNASGSGGGATYGGGMFISGPRNSQGIGCEQGTTACMLLVGQGGDHLTSSLIYHDSTVTCIGTGTSITSAGTVCFAGNVCIGGGLVVQQASTFGNTVALFGSTAQLYIGATAGVSDYTILKWCTTDKSLNIHNQSTNGSPQLVIACNGNVGIKTIAAPSYDLEVRGNIGILSSTSAGLVTTSTLCAAGTVTGLIRFDGLHTPSLTTYTGPSINACKDDANYATSLVFKTTDSSGGNNVNLRIAGTGVASFASTVCSPIFLASGCIGIGTTAPNAQLDAYTSQGGSTIAATHGTGGTYPKASGISFGATSTSLTVCNNSGTTTFTGGAGIYASNGAASNNPTDLVFWTTSAGSPTARLTIASNGVATFSSTITGTTIYGSTAVCSPVGYFSGCVGIGMSGYGGSKLTLVASTNPTCASSANMQLSIGEASQNPTYSFKLGYIYVGGGYIGAIQTIAGGAASTTVINPDGGNVGIGTSSPYQNLTVLKNQNADTAAGIYNQTDGTASSTTLRLDNGSYNGQLNLYSNSYITSGTAVANTLRLYTDGPGGMSFSATNQHMRFYTSPNECLRMTILYGGSVGIGNANPRTQLDVGDIVNGVGGTTFCAFLVAQGVWATFACVTNGDTNVVTDITYVNNNDYNRSGVFVARWAYNDTCAALYIRSCLWNDSQNIGSFGLRNNGGALQICITGGSNGYRVQARTQGARATG